MVVPFVLLLLAIALMPFIHKHYWENHYPKVAIGLGLITAIYYVAVLHSAPRMLLSLIEYVGFIALIGSLYVIAGGIHINMTGRSTPAVNTGLLALGAILANLIGTTGASMLLIRPFLQITNSGSRRITWCFSSSSSAISRGAGRRSVIRRCSWVT